MQDIIIYIPSHMAQQKAAAMMFKLTLMLSPTRGKRSVHDVEYMHERDTTGYGSDLALQILYRNVYDAVFVDDDEKPKRVYYFDDAQHATQAKHRLILGNKDYPENYILTLNGPHAWEYMQDKQAVENRHFYVDNDSREKRTEAYTREYLIPTILSLACSRDILPKWKADIERLISEYDGNNNNEAYIMEHARFQAKEYGNYYDDEKFKTPADFVLVKIGYISQLRWAEAAVHFALEQMARALL